MLKSIIKIWKNRKLILQGIRYRYFPSAYVESIAAKRNEICKKNTCGYYDPHGVNKTCYVKGSSCCSHCGCKLAYKQRSLSAECSLAELGITPLWGKEMTEGEEGIFRKRTGIQNE